VEAISPTLPNDEARDVIKQSKDELLQSINRADREIGIVEQNLKKLQAKQVRINDTVTGKNIVRQSFLHSVFLMLRVDCTMYSMLWPTCPLGAGAELKGDAVVGLHKIYTALERFI